MIYYPKRMFCQSLLLLGFFLFGGLILATPIQEDIHFYQVPEEFKARLIERINQLVEYERTQQYAKLYELYLPDFAHKFFVAKNKEEYERIRREAGEPYEVIVDFKPDEIAVLNDVEYGKSCRIYGQAKIRRAGKEFESQRKTRAVLKAGEWYFVDLWYGVPD